MLLVILEHIIPKSAKGRRQRLIPYNLTLAQHFQLKDLHLPNLSVFCPLVVPYMLWSANIVPKTRQNALGTRIDRNGDIVFSSGN